MNLNILKEFDFVKLTDWNDPKGDYFYDCYGVKYEKKSILSLKIPNREQYERIKIPQISLEWNEEFLENLILLDCIKNTSIKKEKFTFVELGAGYGRYSARAWKFCKKNDFKILSVEAEPFHFQMMLKHFKNNKIHGSNIELYNNVISNTDGYKNFYISSKEIKEISNETAKNWFGQSIVHDWEKKISPVINFFKNFFFYINNFKKVPFFKYIQFYESEFSSIKVKAISLNKLLQNEKKVSLIDMDIQGEEINLVKSEIETLNKKVEKMYIATHSKKIEEEIIKFLEKENWQLKIYLKGETLNKTKFGPIKCQDGVQIWENKSLI